ncbi:hypothetical protein [Streptomyces africanus]|uniref:hypothetical protein n=1 Tax=Streptomyces africanus TaxID=231024 RepID=UPI000A35DC50|nr:hypothetical protein [Streptomyces africanus]
MTGRSKAVSSSVTGTAVERRLGRSLTPRFFARLRHKRDNLCNPLVAVAPVGIDRQTYPLLTGLARGLAPGHAEALVRGIRLLIGLTPPTPCVDPPRDAG